MEALPIIGIALFFIGLGALIRFGKFYGLIAGYNTMSDEDKAKYDIEKIAKLFFFTMTGMAMIMALGVLLTWLTGSEKFQTILFYLSMGIGIPYLLFRSNSSSFKN